MVSCPSTNSNEVDQSSFWDSGGIHWDQHRIGWAIAGACTLVTVIISSISVLKHCRNYTNPTQQRQILRILYMPPVYAIISFISYRFFRQYTYYSLIEVVYEAITMSAFLLLLIDYVAESASGHNVDNAISRKAKSKLLFPAYFMYTLKWSVLQYVIIRPVVSIVGIICQAAGVLCESQGFDARYANVYLESIDFVSISVALYGLLLFYDLTREELRGKRPLAKFLSIKLIVMFTFYQSFVFTALEGRVIKPTQYWTETNIADGLNALAICIEMILFSCLMFWAYTPNEYKRRAGEPPTSIGKPLWDSINYSDFAVEIVGSVRFFMDYFRGKPTAHGHGHLATEDGERHGLVDFGTAFGVENGRYSPARTRQLNGPPI
ncbi:hypothetical protein PC9H_007873 [Pleurotus ostreatus]|uniref:DUF300-domain-containing protein n=1 Tax=Pleurotus ostreatus TaxID=5322 RepID=A0A8H6ZUD6_PLEOS|nr:uncharacterized protein PC9H_007873 [Pleurotus ostreatus]KAF7428646.1 hypothetical protein PC9H_007873 [Pleurotus ostreatus]